MRFGVGKLNGVNSSHWSVKIRSKNAFKSTCNNKRTEELEWSLGFLVTDEKRFRLHLIKGQAYTFIVEVGIRGRIFNGKGRRCRVITGLYIVHQNVWL